MKFAVLIVNKPAVGQKALAPWSQLMNLDSETAEPLPELDCPHCNQHIAGMAVMHAAARVLATREIKPNWAYIDTESAKTFDVRYDKPELGYEEVETKLAAVSTLYLTHRSKWILVTKRHLINVGDSFMPTLIPNVVAAEINPQAAMDWLLSHGYSLAEVGEMFPKKDLNKIKEL